jgi:hypothetical protein
MYASGSPRLGFLPSKNVLRRRELVAGGLAGIGWQYTKIERGWGLTRGAARAEKLGGGRPGHTFSQQIDPQKRPLPWQTRHIHSLLVNSAIRFHHRRHVAGGLALSFLIASRALSNGREALTSALYAGGLLGSPTISFSMLATSTIDVPDSGHRSGEVR